MSYYRNLYHSISVEAGAFWKDLVNNGNTALRWSVWILMGLSLVCMVRILILPFGRKDLRYGTVVFWLVFSVFTAGVGAILFVGADLLLKCPRVYKRPRRILGNVIVPAVTSYTAYVLLTSEYLQVSEKNSAAWAELTGLAVVLLTILKVLLTKNNRSYFRFPKPFRSEALKRYLLLEEEDGIFVWKRYLRFDDATFRLAEVQGLYLPKLYDCLAGILLWVMLTTPYLAGLFIRLGERLAVR